MTIDLVATIQRVRRQHGNGSVSRRPFAIPIIVMADDLLGGHGPIRAQLVGIRACLLHLTLRLRWREYFWIVPSPFEERLFSAGPFGGYGSQDRERALVLVDCLMHTVLEHRKELRDQASGLASLIRLDLLDGFERICDWLNRGVDLRPELNELIVPLESARLKELLSD